MKKKRSPRTVTPPRSGFDATDSDSPTRMKLWLKIIISIFLVYHLIAVAAEPARFASRGPNGPSPATDIVAGIVRPYSEALYLNHGYAFFAPDPGPSHLVRAEMTLADDSTKTVILPNLDEQWPRLYYHRIFMLTEHLNNAFRPENPPPAPLQNPLVLRAWQQERALYASLRRSFGEQLAHRYGATEIKLTRVEHRMPGIPEFLGERIGLDNELLYRDLPEIEPYGPSAATPGAER